MIQAGDIRSVEYGEASVSFHPFRIPNRIEAGTYKFSSTSPKYVLSHDDLKKRCGRERPKASIWRAFARVE